MEDASIGGISVKPVAVPLENGEMSPAKESPVNEFPSTESERTEEPAVDSNTPSIKVNGDSKEEDSDSSDYDNLVIDERPLNVQKRKYSPDSVDGFKGFKRIRTEDEYEPPTNPYFNESLFELSELHQKKNSNLDSLSGASENVCDKQLKKPSVDASARKNTGKRKKVGSPKLREYAQYLGLQPTVQFKCSKCAQSGFPSLAVLNEHHKQCRALGPVATPASTNSSSSTNFRVTRKVFLCSACGTYYENWNLFLHMREVHKRFICLYCLGMFSLPEKLSLHLVSKHNCVPSQLNSEEDFFQTYKDPCFLMCCDCEKVFSERENFFGHNCSAKQNKSAENKSKNNSTTSKSTSQKQIGKNTKQAKNKSFIEHVTGDMPEPEPEPPKTSGTPEMSANEEKEDNADVTESNQESTNQNLSTGEDQEPVEKTECSADDLNVNESDSELKEEEETNVSTCQNLQAEEEHSKSTEENDLHEETADGDDTFKDLDNSTNDSQPKSLENYDEEGSENKDDEEVQEEATKVPKLTLKLPKSISAAAYDDPDDSDASDKLPVEMDSFEADGNDVQANAEETENLDSTNADEHALTVAGPDVPIIELELEQPLDKFDIQILLQKCLKMTIATCVYCNHARKIAVNGQQLGLHAVAEHRFAAVVNSITAEELIPESFVMRIKEGLPELQNVYFNLEGTANDDGVSFSHVFECFQCRYATAVHKELYLHNRKMHAKTILLCIMCKSNFYSYSELICHLCPGLYELNNDVHFRCCMCVTDDLPSAFRLMVHLRKRHHVCDVCLELCHSQSRLSNHVWKHKLHHLCYRCGIAYRNKPDITKHLFWKHGTESVLCKKCLQKKWPHVYHFCIPPSSFTCEECSLSFTKAVALKVHKRLHSDERPHACAFEDCPEKFISKKLLLKHDFKHREPPEAMLEKDDGCAGEHVNGEASAAENVAESKEEVVEEEKPRPKPKVDVYDLPELNLSESDSSDSEPETKSEKKETEEEPNSTIPLVEEALEKIESSTQMLPVTDVSADETKESVGTEPAVPVLDDIWNNFKNYQASKEKLETVGSVKSATEVSDSLPSVLEDVIKDDVMAETSADVKSDAETQKRLTNIVMMDHDYSVLSQELKPDPVVDVQEPQQSIDHDYCSASTVNITKKREETAEQPKTSPAKESKEPKASSSSDSSDSDSSSCTCGSNCSCSSSSDSSSSSSDSSESDSSSSEGRRKQQARRERRKQRTKNKKENARTSPVEVVATDQQFPQVEQHIQESDLDTSESDTDEDFYDKQPQKLANKLLAEKRKELMLLAGIGTLVNGSIESSRPSTPSLPETEEVKPKKKSKNKKKKKKSKKQDKSQSDIPNSNYQYQYQPSTVSPLTITLPKNSPRNTPTYIASPKPLSVDEQVSLSADSDSHLRASKRRRIPNKFYGYSSDEEQDKHQPPVLKWRKADLPSPVRSVPSSPLVVPPITIKAIPSLNTNDEAQVRPAMVSVAERVPPLPQHPFQPQPSTQVAAETSSDNDSSSEEEQPPHQPQPPAPPLLFLNKPNQPPLYCYCRCPYDEVSEMIGCDSNDCAIEWFHFECVGIMVPPKGQWFCPDCRKKKQQRKELAQT